MRKQQSIPEAHQQYDPVRVKKNNALTFTFFLQYHNCPGADERCTVSAVGQLNSVPLSTHVRQPRTAGWVVFICRYVILFRSHLSLAPRTVAHIILSLATVS
jgi:hypothetical protein